MAGYVHRTERIRRQEAAQEQAVPATVRERLVVAAAEEVLRHRQTVQAGVLGCGCKQVTFRDYQTMPAEHARHTAEAVVGAVLDGLAGARQAPPAALAAVGSGLA